MSSFYLSGLLKCCPLTWAVYWNVVHLPELYIEMLSSFLSFTSILKSRPLTWEVYWNVVQLPQLYIDYWKVVFLPELYCILKFVLLPERYIEMSSCYLSGILKCLLVTWAVYWNVVLLPELYIEMSSCYLSCILKCRPVTWAVFPMLRWARPKGCRSVWI